MRCQHTFPYAYIFASAGSVFPCNVFGCVRTPAPLFLSSDHASQAPRVTQTAIMSAVFFTLFEVRYPLLRALVLTS